MREALAEALSDFDGAIVLVSHDRHLIGLVSDTFWRVHDGVVEPFDGDLDEYAAWLRSRSGESRPASSANPNAAPAKSVGRISTGTPVKAAKPAKVNPHKLAQAESRVEALAAQIAEVEANLADPQAYADGGKRVAELGARQAALRAQMDAAEAELLALYDAA
jgi:ATP-binding cassette subfamily F protein 3